MVNTARKYAALSLAILAGLAVFLLWVWLFPGVLRALERDRLARIEDHILLVELLGILAYTICSVSMIAGRLLHCHLVRPGEAGWWRKTISSPAAFLVPLAAIIQWIQRDFFAAIVSTAVAAIAVMDLWSTYRTERANAQ